MPESKPHINLSELNNALSQNVIHYDPTRIDYTINDFELSQIEEYGSSLWKDIFFASIGIAIPTLINGIVLQNKLAKNEPWTKEMFLNYLIGGISLGISIFSLIFWVRNNRKKPNIIEQIKKKPQFMLPHASSQSLGS